MYKTSYAYFRKFGGIFNFLLAIFISLSLSLKKKQLTFYYNNYDHKKVIFKEFGKFWQF